jgi:hypothetical protein
MPNHMGFPWFVLALGVLEPVAGSARKADHQNIDPTIFIEIT